MAQFPGQLTIVAVGKLRQRHWQAAQTDYLSRLKWYIQVQCIEVKDAVGRRRPNAVAIQREGEDLLAAADAAGRKIALTPAGRQMTSPELALYLQKQLEVYGHLTFLIGGPLGFAAEVLTGCDEQLSLSALTFPHELARVLLLEQLYRAFTILNGEKYHK